MNNFKQSQMDLTKTKQDPEISLKVFFHDLFEYNQASNDIFILVMFENEKLLSDKTVPVLNHIINAHQIWNNRIEKRDSQYGIWEIHKFRDLERLNKSNHEFSFEILQEYSLEKELEYANSKGQVFVNSIKDVLFHVINHSNYHRAQLAMFLKKLGIDPPKSDYIFYKR